MTKNHSFFCM